jgi:hypothetical protein
MALSIDPDAIYYIAGTISSPIRFHDWIDGRRAKPDLRMVAQPTD